MTDVYLSIFLVSAASFFLGAAMFAWWQARKDIKRIEREQWEVEKWNIIQGAKEEPDGSEDYPF